MVIARAPVRISFGGGGTDLAAYYQQHGGFVVSTAIDRYCSVMAHRPAVGGVHIASSDFNLSLHFPPGELPPVHEPLSLPKAALTRFALHGIRESGIDLFTASEIPPGTGLGSSSAMACALVCALSHLGRTTLTKTQVAEIACELEIEYLCMPIGRQDQYASAIGGLNTIEFTCDGVTVTPIDLPSDVMNALSRRLLLFSTGSSRDSASILGKQRAATTTDQSVIDSLHRIKDLAHANWHTTSTASASSSTAAGRKRSSSHPASRRQRSMAGTTPPALSVRSAERSLAPAAGASCCSTYHQAGPVTSGRQWQRLD
jgi:D-glycero-alpha-D-manno-heptose-7-phosphate kinase